MKKKINREDVYLALKQYIAEWGFPPTSTELCKACGIQSKSTIHTILKELEEDGRIERIPHSARAIRIKE